MTKPWRITTIAALITSPLWIGIILNTVHKTGPEDWSGLAIIVAVIFGVPLIAILGLLFSFMFRRRLNAARLSIASYLVPASIVVIWEIYTFYR